MADEKDEARVTRWRCPRCRFWVHEPMAKCCELCKECIREAAEEANQHVKTEG